MVHASASAGRGDKSIKIKIRIPDKRRGCVLASNAAREGLKGQCRTCHRLLGRRPGGGTLGACAVCSRMCDGVLFHNDSTIDNAPGDVNPLGDLFKAGHGNFLLFRE